MSVKVKAFSKETRKVVAELENYKVVEYLEDITGAHKDASKEYFENVTGIRRRQLFVELNGDKTLVMQAGGLMWVAGNVEIVTGVKNERDFIKKLFFGKVSKESVIKPEYSGTGLVAMEPTHKYIFLQDVSSWGEEGMIIEDGMFYACDKTVKHSAVSRENVSSAVLGNEGLINLCLSGTGVVALESIVPQEELVEIDLIDDVLKIDGSYAICWSASLEFSVERSSKTLAGSAVNKEGLLNVYRGTGKVWISGINSVKDVESVPSDKKD